MKSDERSTKRGGKVRRLIVAASIAAILPLLAVEETWIGGSSSLWSGKANWLDGSAPLAGGATDLTLRFAPANPNPFQANNDLGNPFVVNRLVLANDSTGELTIGNMSGDSVELGGANAG